VPIGWYDEQDTSAHSVAHVDELVGFASSRFLAVQAHRPHRAGLSSCGTPLRWPEASRRLRVRDPSRRPSGQCQWCRWVHGRQVSSYVLLRSYSDPVEKTGFSLHVWLWDMNL